MPRKPKPEIDPLRAVFDEAVVDHLCLEEVPPLDARFCEMDGADSLDVVELVMHCEDEFGLEVDDGELADMKTMGDLWKIVNRRATKGRGKAEAARA